MIARWWRDRRVQALVAGGLLVAGVAVALMAGRAERGPVVAVRRGALTSRLTTTGTLRPAAAITYRSPVAGRELEILALVPEGSTVAEGDHLVRFDTTELALEVDRARQELVQAELDLDVADADLAEAVAAARSLEEGEGALTAEEVRVRLQLAQRKAERLHEEHSQLVPLLEKGVITAAELARVATEVEGADEELALARRRADVLERVTRPRDTARIALQRAQKDAQRGRARARAADASLRIESLKAQMAACSIVARHGGLVVYEEFLNTVPRRKVRVGDRVTSSQGVITIPEVSRMMVETSVSEADVQRVRPGQAALVSVEGLPDLRLHGVVERVGTLASTSMARPFDDKRFDLVIALTAGHEALRPEMTARADIDIATRDGVLLVPIDAVFEEGGRFVVRVPGLRGSTSRAVRLGVTSDDLVEVLDGVAEGESVLRAAPAVAAPRPAAGDPRAPY